MKKIVITGGPCVGKTTTINLLKDKGIHVIDEVPRDIIASEQRKKIENPLYNAIVPWTNIDEFQKLVIAEQLKRENSIPEDTSAVLLDRSLVDIFGYCKVAGINPPAELFSLVKNAGYDKVIFLEQLNNYATDSERKEDLVMAKKIHDEILNSYRELGFPIIVVPAFDGKAKERAEFVKKHLI